MRSERQRSADVPHSNSTIKFLIGIGVGIAFGWLGTLFRRRPGTTEATVAVDERQDNEEHSRTQTTYSLDSRETQSNVTPVLLREPTPGDQSRQTSDAPATQLPPIEANLTTWALPLEGCPQQWRADELNAELGSAENASTIHDDYEFASDRVEQRPLVGDDEIKVRTAFASKLELPTQQANQTTVGSISTLQVSPPEDDVIEGDSGGCSLPNSALNNSVGASLSLSDSEGFRENDPVLPDVSSISKSQQELIIERPRALPDSAPSRSFVTAVQGADELIDPEPQLRSSNEDFPSEIGEKPTARSSSYRARTAESPQEYTGRHFEQLPTTYLEWNRRLTEHVIVSAQKNEDVFLSITPTILASVATLFSENSLPSPEVEADFTAAIGSAYALVIAQDGRLRTLRRTDAQGQPLCVGFLAASVLAAYGMHSDEDASGGAYYFRLAGILGCDMAGSHPQGFDPAVFESLWVFFQKWLADTMGARLAMPGAEVGIRRFVALPLMHVPLRRLDIEKLPSFFVWAGYSAGARVHEKKLLYDLERWTRSYSAFSSAGLSALTDERRHAVASQVAQELAAWDGSSTESSGRRSASVELLLDILRYRPDFSYLPRRPIGFPQSFDDGEHVFNAADDGWYEQFPVPPSAGPELANGFEWKGRQEYSFRRPPSAVVPLAAHPDYSFFVSRSNLLRGACCAVLIQDGLATTAAGYLSLITNSTCSPISHPNIPLGWKLFANVRPQRRAEIPKGLDALDLDTQVSIICSGGLRVGRRREWLAGAPPKIVVTGLEEGDVVRVDGHIAVLSEDGFVQRNGHSFEPGVHLVEAGGQRTSFEIVNARIGDISPLRLESRRYVTLPQGRWALLGAMPGEASGLISVGRHGLMHTAEFDPVWAVSVRSGPGAVVVSLKASPSPPHPVARFGSKRAAAVQRWVNLVYDAAIRRPNLNSLFPTVIGDQITNAWGTYVKVAKQIKRDWRNSR
jgi:hypothetical protein